MNGYVSRSRLSLFLIVITQSLFLAEAESRGEDLIVTEDTTLDPRKTYGRMVIRASNITVDGREITARPGQTVIQAAQDAGIYIPYLCYFPGMKPYGSNKRSVGVRSSGSSGRAASL